MRKYTWLASPRWCDAAPVVGTDLSFVLLSGLCDGSDSDGHESWQDKADE